jgi:hypothetical protein
MEITLNSKMLLPIVMVHFRQLGFEDLLSLRLGTNSDLARAVLAQPT